MKIWPVLIRVVIGSTGICADIGECIVAGGSLPWVRLISVRILLWQSHVWHSLLNLLWILLQDPGSKQYRASDSSGSAQGATH